MNGRAPTSGSTARRWEGVKGKETVGAVAGHKVEGMVAKAVDGEAQSARVLARQPFMSGAEGQRSWCQEPT